MKNKHAHTYHTDIPFAWDLEKPPVIYLSASVHNYYRGRAAAGQMVCSMIKKIMNKGYAVFCFAIYRRSVMQKTERVRQDDLWTPARLQFVPFFDELWVYQMEGWDKDPDILCEIECAKNNNIPIKYMTMEGNLNASEFG